MLSQPTVALQSPLFHGGMGEFSLPVTGRIQCPAQMAVGGKLEEKGVLILELLVHTHDEGPDLQRTAKYRAVVSGMLARESCGNHVCVQEQRSSQGHPECVSSWQFHPCGWGCTDFSGC